MIKEKEKILWSVINIYLKDKGMRLFSCVLICLLSTINLYSQVGRLVLISDPVTGCTSRKIVEKQILEIEKYQESVVLISGYHESPETKICRRRPGYTIDILVYYPSGIDTIIGVLNGPDSDFDGIHDINDQCEGYDDNLDSDFDGVPDGCDECQGFDDFAIPHLMNVVATQDHCYLQNQATLYIDTKIPKIKHESSLLRIIHENFDTLIPINYDSRGIGFTSNDYTMTVVPNIPSGKYSIGIEFFNYSCPLMTKEYNVYRDCEICDNNIDDDGDDLIDCDDFDCLRPSQITKNMSAEALVKYDSITKPHCEHVKLVDLLIEEAMRESEQIIDVSIPPFFPKKDYKGEFLSSDSIILLLQKDNFVDTDWKIYPSDQMSKILFSTMAYDDALQYRTYLIDEINATADLIFKKSEIELSNIVEKLKDLNLNYLRMKGFGQRLLKEDNEEYHSLSRMVKECFSNKLVQSYDSIVSSYKTNYLKENSLTEGELKQFLQWRLPILSSHIVNKIQEVILWHLKNSNNNKSKN